SFSVETFEDEDQTVAVWIRQRPQQHLVDHREDGRIATNPEAERENRRLRETRAAPQRPAHVTDIARQVLEGRRATLVVTSLLHAQHAAEPAAGFCVGGIPG